MNIFKIHAAITLITLSVIPLISCGTVTKGIESLMKTQKIFEAILELPSVMSKVTSDPKLLALRDGDERTATFIKLLQNETSRAQEPLVSIIKQHVPQNQIENFWITNKIFIKKVTPRLVQALKDLPGPHTLREVILVSLVEPIQFSNSTIVEQSRDNTVVTPEWGVVKIRTLDAWALGYDGTGVIVANIDSGVNFQHEALYANRDFMFYDGINDRPAVPFDDNGHGTHTMGTMCGINGIGVARGAKWVACKGLDENTNGDENTVRRCAQFLLKLKTNKPKIISNSWGGGPGLDFFDDEIRAWQAANIIPVFSIGNAGPNCNTARSPGDRADVISAGAVDGGELIASFSSRGYAVGTNLFKPEVAAPGVNVISAWKGGNNQYAVLSGTSMAAPHVAGAIAILLQKKPGLTFAAIKDKLQSTAFKTSLSSSERACGYATGLWPNNVYGGGRIDVYAAVQAV